MSSEKLHIETIGTSKVDVDAVLSRMKEAFGVKDDGELGILLVVQSSTTFKVWRNRKSIPQSYYAYVSEKTGKSVRWLKTGNDDGLRDVTNRVALSPDGFILIPHYEVQASAGNGSLVHSEQIVDYLAFRADWVRNTLGVAQADLALISVKGDSMEPALSNDDLILVDMRKNRVEDNAIYVLQLNGTLLVKRIQHKLDGSLCVMSDNPRYEAEMVSADRSGDLNVLGRVVWSGRRM